MPESGAFTTVFYQNDCAPDGKSPLFMRNLDVYYAKGEPNETYECRFAYTGFRYVWVECLDDPAQIVQLTHDIENGLCEITDKNADFFA
jgi:hypothetical protein